MKKMTFLCILIFISTNIFTNEINEYDLILIQSINTGSQKGELGDTTPFKKMGGVPINPFTISEEGFIYICDFMNQRINIYDLNFTFNKEIKDNRKSYLHKAYIIKVNNTRDIIGLTSNGLIKIDNTGQELFKIDINDLSNEVIYNHEYFLLDNYILYYEKEKYHIIDVTGKKLNEQDSREEIRNMQTKQAENLKNNNFTKEEPIQVQSYLNTINVINFDSRILTGDFKKIKEYNKFMNTLNKNIKALEDGKSNILSFLTEYDKNINIVGYDEAGNSYWKTYTKKEYGSKPVILVCSKYGEIIDCFYNELSLPNIAIAPNGDVYFMDRTPRDGKFLFYKITRRW